MISAIIIIARQWIHVHALLEDASRGNFSDEAVSVLVSELPELPAYPLEVSASDILHPVSFPDFHVRNLVLLVILTTIVCIRHIELILAAILISVLELPPRASQMRLKESLLPRGPAGEIVLDLRIVGLLQILKVESFPLKV